MKKFPFWYIFRVSIEKVEKVVNPPQNPIINKLLPQPANQSYLNENPKSTPIKKHPKMLTIKVPIGKTNGNNLNETREIK